MISHSKKPNRHLIYTGDVAGTNQRHMISHGKIILTKKYRDFKHNLVAMWYDPKFKTLKKDIEVIIYMYMDKRRDADSLLKPIFDALQDAKIIKNDNQIKKFTVIKRPSSVNVLDVYIYEVKNDMGRSDKTLA